MPSERRGKGMRAPPRSRMPAPPRRRGRGGVGLAEGARCGGRFASVVPTGRGHWSAEVVLWVPAALRLMQSETRERDAGAAAVAGARATEAAGPRRRRAGRGRKVRRPRRVRRGPGARAPVRGSRPLGGRSAPTLSRKSTAATPRDRSQPKSDCCVRICCKTRAGSKAVWSAAGRVCCAIYHPHHRACSAQ